MAREHGIPAAAIEAIRSGGDFSFTTEADRLVHAVALHLTTTGRIDEATYAKARRLLGDRGMVELVALCGYYALVSFMLNAFEVPLPTGVPPPWPDVDPPGIGSAPPETV
jgi:4-carboxymuconolactone decarboxylase